jgi:iron complex transport system ATP-binding protein
VVIGPNGTGKSTLLKCIDGLLKVRSGTVSVDGRPTRKMGKMEMARQFGYVPQKSFALFPFSVFDMVLMGRHPHRKRGEPNVEKALNALRRLGIEDLAMKNFNEISGGQQQKVSIARAIAQEAGILLLDEPTSSLDLRHQLEVMQLLRQTVDQNATAAILTMHDLNLAARYADKVILLNQGKIVDAGRPVFVLTHENIASVYGVEARVVNVAGIPCIVPLTPL